MWLHHRNKHQGHYDFDILTSTCPKLSKYVISANHAKGARATIDFGAHDAVSELNRALLMSQYKINSWKLPQGRLCPPVPGRADYIHYLADLLGDSKQDGSKTPPKGDNVRGLDIGTGASCIYPLIGSSAYGWSFLATESNVESFEWAVANASSNSGNIELLWQASTVDVLEGILLDGQEVDFVMCNPPFHSSATEAARVNTRKISNLKSNRKKRNGDSRRVHQDTGTSGLNFGGVDCELWCNGGEVAFIERMIEQSCSIANQSLWFTSLVSRKAHLSKLYDCLDSTRGIQGVKTIPMGQGQKTSRILAWSFQTKPQAQSWCNRRWLP
jgi:23S rRNA (adenine1618-N6)-methyltransferase